MYRKKGTVVHPDGYLIGYEQIGESQAPHTIVLLNGSLFNYLQWDLIIKKLVRVLPPHMFRIIRYDYGGTGTSPWRKVVWDIEHVADELLVLIDGLGISKVHLYGISKGTIVGQVFAGRYPDRVASLAGYGWFHFAYSAMPSLVRFFDERVCHFAFMAESPAVPLTWSEFKKLSDLVFSVVLFHSKSNASWYMKILRYFLHRRVYRLLAPTPARTMYEWFSYAVRMMGKGGEFFAPYYPHLAQIPLLIQHARNDGTLPYEMAEELSRKLPHARCSTYGKGYNHVTVVVMPSHAEAIMKEYALFLTQR